jgi:hypothetical protein
MSDTPKDKSHQSYTSKQVRKHAEGDFNSRAGALVGKDDGDFSALVSNRASDLLRRLALRNRIDGNVKRITSRRANLLYDALVAVIEHLVRAQSPDEIEVFTGSRCQDAESAHFRKLDGVLTNGRCTAPNENGAMRIGGGPGLEGRRQLESLMQALQGGYWSHAQLRRFFKRPTARDGHDAEFGICN